MNFINIHFFIPIDRVKSIHIYANEYIDWLRLNKTTDNKFRIWIWKSVIWRCNLHKIKKCRRGIANHIYLPVKHILKMKLKLLQLSAISSKMERVNASGLCAITYLDSKRWFFVETKKMENKSSANNFCFSESPKIRDRELKNPKKLAVTKTKSICNTRTRKEQWKIARNSLCQLNTNQDMKQFCLNVFRLSGSIKNISEGK